jgi:hypothetical protein
MEFRLKEKGIYFVENIGITTIDYRGFKMVEVKVLKKDERVRGKVGEVVSMNKDLAKELVTEDIITFNLKSEIKKVKEEDNGGK